MIVVSDTSPITALLTIGAAELLAQLFQEVVIPPAVRDELLRSHARLPAWLQVKAVQSPGQVRTYAQSVDLGEAEAIQLAQELHADPGYEIQRIRPHVSHCGA
jgi:uncharacterized protein